MKECNRPAEQSLWDELRGVTVKRVSEKQMELIDVSAGTEQEFTSLLGVQGFRL